MLMRQSVEVEFADHWPTITIRFSVAVSVLAAKLAPRIVRFGRLWLNGSERLAEARVQSRLTECIPREVLLVFKVQATKWLSIWVRS